MAHLNTKEIALMGILSALLIIGQVALGFLPNIEVVTLLVIAYTLVFGKKVFFIIYIFVLVEGLIYGFGLWWINYLECSGRSHPVFQKTEIGAVLEHPFRLFWDYLRRAVRAALFCHRGPAGGVCLLDIRPGL
jgi:hypothetical protein